MLFGFNDFSFSLRRMMIILNDDNTEYKAAIAGRFNEIETHSTIAYGSRRISCVF